MLTISSKKGVEFLDIFGSQRANLLRLNHTFPTRDFYVADYGDDSALGDVSHPVKTLTEVARRLHRQLIETAVNIYLLTDITDSPCFYLDIKNYYTSYIWIHGTKTLIGSGSFTSVQKYVVPTPNSSTRSDQQITDSNLPVSWTASGFVGKIIYITSGPNSGSYAWVYQDLGSKKAIVSPFFNPLTYSRVDPEVGDTYSVYSLSKLSGSLMGSCEGSIYVENVDIDTGVPNPGIEPVDWSRGRIGFFGCRINGNDTYPVPVDSYGGHFIISGGGSASSFGCYISTHVRAFNGASHYVSCCVFDKWGTAPTADGGGSVVSIYGPCVGYGEQTFPQARNKGRVIVETGAWYMAANQTTGLWARVDCDIILQGKVWGFGITDNGVFMGSGANVYYAANMEPDFVNNTVGPTYPTKQIDLGGTTKNFSDLSNSAGVYNSTSDAKMVPLYYIY